MKKSNPLAMFSVGVTALAILGSGPALAGERTGTGEPTPLEGASLCKYSGLNDDPEGADPANGPPGRTQSYGQDVSMGHASPSDFDPDFEGEFQAHPGWACNPTSFG